MRACAACGHPLPIRWRNDPHAPRDPNLEHIAGPIVRCVECRRGCPTYVVDRRQACERCGKELARGKWGLFFVPGELVVEHVNARIFHNAPPRASDPPAVACAG